ncbi:citrate lyase subunit alpha [bacterium]|nr:citrate lyase subunit alpha [bacterium]
MIQNAVGRLIPDLSDRGLVGFRGVDQPPLKSNQVAPAIRTCSEFPANGDKRVESLREALRMSGLRDGMVVSTHHHLRNGDAVAIQLFAAIRSLGVRDIVWFPSAVFPCHEELIPFLEDGTIHHIEGSLNGPLGDYASGGRMRGLAVLRSHGNRYRSIQDGDVHVDVAVIAAPASDHFGNCTGALGPSACGGLGFAMADAEYADRVIVVTDHLVDFPCVPWQIAGNHIDHVVEVNTIGDSTQIVAGTTVLTSSPERQRIARLAAEFVDAAGIVRDGWSFQAGAGGISLSFVVFVQEIMARRGVRAGFARGGSTKYLVEMLESGQLGAILDGQTFDLEGVRSMRENRSHVMTTPWNSYCAHTKGNFASMLDCAVLGATEVDVNFNANVVTHSDGRLLHGIGGWQDALLSQCTILAVPSLRNRVPIIRDELTTVCGSGELIDVVVTERGIAVNPRRMDLIEAVEGSDLPLKSIAEIQAESEKLAGGKPARVDLDDELIGLVTWIDGTVIDTVRRVRTRA